LGRTILVADDSPTIQKKASGILTGEGLDVVTVSNGVAAVKKLPTVNPLVVLADVSMPGKDGYEVCEHIKSNTSLSHISVLLIFSDTDPYEEARGSRVGADGRIKKPFERDDLIATVSKFVAQSEAALVPKQAPPKLEIPAEYEVEPVDEEQEAAAKDKSPDFAAFSGGVAFGVSSIEEIPSVPADAAPSEPMPAEPIPSEEESAAVAEEVVPESEMAISAPPEADAGPSMVMAEQAEVISSSEPAPEVVEPMLVEEAAAPEDSSEEAGEHTMMFRAPADIAQPILSDEGEVAPLSEPAMAEAPAPAEEPPAAEPVEAAAEPAPPEARMAEQSEDITPAGGTPIPPQTLESYTLNEAAEGHVHFGSPETGLIPEPDRTVAPPPPEEPEPAPPAPVAAPAYEPEVMLPEPPAPEAEAVPPPPEEPVAAAEPAPPPVELAPLAKTVDEAQVFSIVHKVVLKMSPPALSPQMVEDLARKFADEITAELKSES
jgi:CheY-like chemotaxis protein